jgi:hypothetical protein
VPYIQYLLPGSITMSIFMMVMIGGGIIFIDDKARGLHEGYLVTPITSPGADPRLQPVGHHQGRARRARADDDRIGDRGHSRRVRIRCGCCVSSSSSSSRRSRSSHDVLDHGAGEGSAPAARDLRRAQHPALFPERRRLHRRRLFRSG